MLSETVTLGKEEIERIKDLINAFDRAYNDDKRHEVTVLLINYLQKVML